MLVQVMWRYERIHDVNVKEKNFKLLQVIYLKRKKSTSTQKYSKKK